VTDAPTARTEGLAQRQVLPVTAAGEPYDLRVLSMDESDAWVRRCVQLSLGELPEDATDDVDGITMLLTAGGHRARELVRVYDVDGILADGILERMTKKEVRDAALAMADSEDPFGEGARRLVEDLLGTPSSLLAATTRRILTTLTPMDDPTTTEEEPAASSDPGRSPNGPSEPGDSTGTEISALSGPASASSSSGSEATSASDARLEPSERPSPMASASAMPRPRSPRSNGEATNPAGGATTTSAPPAG
jgi:hypothetical protein